MNKISGFPLIDGGPVIPTHLRRELDAGNVVFFCGAGISYPTLPNFKDLTKRLFAHAGLSDMLSKTGFVMDHIDRGQYDRALDWLKQKWNQGPYNELDLFGKAIQEELKFKNEAALETHKALLALSTNRVTHETRLVTTNQDNAFDLCNEMRPTHFRVDYAPKLPIPKKDRWHSVVYLHGHISQETDTFIFTSSEFGTAYLTEGWATRFVLELLQHFTVVFVGYSLEDATIRYITDAIGRDELHGVSKFNKPYAFAEYCETETGKNRRQMEEQWSAKHVLPILYDSMDLLGVSHGALHLTLRKWAELYSKGFEHWYSHLQVTMGLPPDSQNPSVQLILQEVLELRTLKYVSAFIDQLARLEDANQLFAWLELISTAETERLQKYREDQQKNRHDDLTIPVFSAELSPIFCSLAHSAKDHCCINPPMEYALAEFVKKTNGQ